MRAIFGLCALSLVAALAEVAAQKISLFAGNEAGTGTSKKISAFPALALNYTLISANDFACTDAWGCELLPQNYTLNVSGRLVTYQEAYMPLNLIPQPFPERVKVFYLPLDAYNIGSVVGLRRGSAFLDYLYAQDIKSGYRIRFLIDSKNNLRFLDALNDERLEKAEYEMNAVVKFPAAPALDGQNLRFCISNSADRNTGPVYFLVSPDKLPLWQSGVVAGLQGGSAAAQQNAVVLSLNSGFNTRFGEISLTPSELIEEGSVLVGVFNEAFDQQRGCDIYTGSLLLAKYNFLFYYIEYDEAYEVKFTFDSYAGAGAPRDEEPVLEERKPGLWWKILLFSAIMGAVGYACYYFIHREKKPIDVYKQQPVAEEEYEMDMLQEPKSPAKVAVITKP